MKLLRTILLIALVVVIIAAAGALYMLNQLVQDPIPQHAGTLNVAGLQDTVTIIRDEYGIPHIYASNVHDLRFAQGYTQAQDRWWQMEFYRHTGRGAIQELTGQTNSLMSTDIFIRSVGWQRAAERDLAALSEESISELQSFADGVNAYIGNRSPQELALEYPILGVTGVNIPIEPWSPVDTIVWTKAMAWDLGGNESDERYRAELVEALGEDLVDDYLVNYPYGDKVTIIQLEDLPQDGAPFEPIPIEPDTAGIGLSDIELAGNFDSSQGLIFDKGSDIGSNNWVVSGNMTTSGMPLLANDPHLGIRMPSIWYEIGLHCAPVTDACPYDVRGFTFAPSPGIISGHTPTIGWGVTNVGWDTQDLYLITVNPDNELQYLWDGEWRDMQVYDETIRFGDGGEITIRVRETHLGPIINDNRIDKETNEILGFNNENPLALHWTGNDTSNIINAILELNRATNWDEFRDALRDWNAPAQNFVYADIYGNIGYQTPGTVPVRTNGHTGLLPVDGSTSANEWLGYVPYENLPSVLNPERGYIATANQALVPLEYYDYLRQALADTYGEDAHYIFDYSWDIGYRGQRIVNLLESTSPHNLETFRAIQGDNYIALAEEIAPYITELDMGSEALNENRDWMMNWDYQMHMDSPQAALFGYFIQELLDNIYEDQLADLGNAGGAGSFWATKLLMEEPDNAWWDDTATADVVETRDEIIIRSFSDAHAAAVARLGADRNKWKWGTVHTSTFVSNPLGASGISLLENVFNSGPHATSGGTSMVNATNWNYTETGFPVRSLPSYRMVLDFSNLNNSQTVHTTGQSGHPFSEDYEAFIDDWRNINYHPMYSDRATIESNAQDTLILQPAQ